MNIAQQMLAIAICCTVCTTAMAQNESKQLGTVSKLLSQGYRFVGGNLSVEKEDKVAINQTPPINYSERKYHDGYLYLQKDNDLAACLVQIVKHNPSKDYYGPGSICFQVK